MFRGSSPWFLAGFLSLVAIVVSVPGCGTKEAKLTIRGTVSYKGKPLSGGMLKLVGRNGASLSAAPIQKDGTFIMTDVAVGEVNASILATPGTPDRSGAKTTSDHKITPADLPEKYQDPEKSGLQYTITPDTKELDIKID
jgi:hypothetical protein